MSRRASLLVSALSLALGAARSASEDIEYWKGTVKGPGKIIAVMLADKYPMELRTQAALALVDMERTDRDGTAELQQALQRLDDSERARSSIARHGARPRDADERSPIPSARGAPPVRARFAPRTRRSC